MGDVALGLAGLSLVAAMAWPWLEHGAFLDRVEIVTAAVEDARTAVLRFREEEGAWPPAAEPGHPPEALAPYLQEAASFRGEGHLLEIAGWEVLQAPSRAPDLPTGAARSARAREEPLPDSVQVPGPEAVPLVGLRVHAAEEAILAALLQAYGSTHSFVRDTTWTLIFPRSPPTP